MVAQEEFIKKVVSEVAAEVADKVRVAAEDAVETHLSEALRKALAESEFYRRLSDEMLSGLQKVYKEIHSASKEDKVGAALATDQPQTGKLFSDASRQLDEIMTTTFEATENIMSKTEEMFDRQQESAGIIAELQAASTSSAGLERLGKLNEQNDQAITAIMEALSFQDLTGQRLKKVVASLSKIEAEVFELYMAGGLMMKTSEADKCKGFEEVAVETRRTLTEIKEVKGSELKGPTLNAPSQSAVDDLLADLGL